jgi:hypothetical protein
MRKSLLSLVLLAALGSSPALADSNIAYINQIGNNNGVSVSQDGLNQFARTYQDGNRNDIKITQSGAPNRAEVTQYGNNNAITYKQVGSGAVIKQQGFGHQATVVGNVKLSQPITVKQSGVGAKVAIVTTR